MPEVSCDVGEPNRHNSMKTIIEKLVSLAKATEDNVGLVRDLVRAESSNISKTAETVWRECRKATKAATVSVPMTDEKGQPLNGPDGKPATKTVSVPEKAAPTGGLFHAAAQLALLVELGCVPEDKQDDAFLALAYSENGSGWRQLYEPADKKETEKAAKPTLASLGFKK